MKLLHRVWSKSENPRFEPSGDQESRIVSNDIENLAGRVNSLSISKSSVPSLPSTKATQRQPSNMCSLVPQLFDALSSLAQLYTHYGLHPESQYYMEQSAIVAKNAGLLFQSRYHAQIGQYLICSGNLEDGKSHLNQAEAACGMAGPSGNFVAVQMVLVEMYTKTKGTHCWSSK